MLQDLASRDGAWVVVGQDSEPASIRVTNDEELENALGNAELVMGTKARLISCNAHWLT